MPGLHFRLVELSERVTAPSCEPARLFLQEFCGVCRHFSARPDVIQGSVGLRAMSACCDALMNLVRYDKSFLKHVVIKEMVESLPLRWQRRQHIAVSTA